MKLDILDALDQMRKVRPGRHCELSVHMEGPQYIVTMVTSDGTNACQYIFAVEEHDNCLVGEMNYNFQKGLAALKRLEE